MIPHGWAQAVFRGQQAGTDLDRYSAFNAHPCHLCSSDVRLWLLHFQLESTAAHTRQSGSLLTDVFCLIIKLSHLWLAEGYTDPLWYKVRDQTEVGSELADPYPCLPSTVSCFPLRRSVLWLRLHREVQILPEATGKQLPLTSANLLETFKSCRGGEHDQNPFLITRSIRGAACLPSSFLNSATTSPGKAFLPCVPLTIHQRPFQGGGSWVQQSCEGRTARIRAAQGLYKYIHCLNHQRSLKTKQK